MKTINATYKDVTPKHHPIVNLIIGAAILGMMFQWMWRI